METHEKPRVTLAEFQEMMKRPPTYAEGTLADWIEKFIREREQPGGRMIGSSQKYTLRRIQRAPLGAAHHTDLKAMHFLAHCKARRATGILPQTITQDMTFTSGVIKYAYEIWEIETADKALKVYKKAIPQLKKEQLIAKAPARDRRPTQAELDQILAEFALPPKNMTKNHIPMVPIVKFSYTAGRRISETCRIARKDVDTEKRLCTVRDLKNSKGKGFHDTFPLLGEAWDIVAERLAVIPNDPDARLFPYRSASCSAKYTRVKKKLDIPNLRLHDNRRHCFSGLFEQGFSVPEVQKVSLHRNPTILLKNYTALTPESLHLGPAAKR